MAGRGARAGSGPLGREGHAGRGGGLGPQQQASREGSGESLGGRRERPAGAGKGAGGAGGGGWAAPLGPPPLSPAPSRPRAPGPPGLPGRGSRTPPWSGSPTEKPHPPPHPHLPYPQRGEPLTAPLDPKAEDQTPASHFQCPEFPSCSGARDGVSRLCTDRPPPSPPPKAGREIISHHPARWGGGEHLLGGAINSSVA